MRKTAAAGLCSVMLLAACSSDEEPEDQPTPEETQTSEENSGPGAGAITETAEPAEPEETQEPAEPEETQEPAEPEETQEPETYSEPDPTRTIDVEDEDPRSGDGEGVEPDEGEAAAAYQRASDASEDVAGQTDLSQWQMPDDVSEITDEVGTGWWVEREQEVGHLFAETAAGYRPADDFNRDEAFVRASYLLHESDRPSGSDVSDYPAIDEAWESAAECNAETEVYSQHQTNEDEHSHTPDFTLFVEYRWVDGDAGCELIQPDEFYEYRLIINDAGLLTISNRVVHDETLVDRPSGWE